MRTGSAPLDRRFNARTDHPMEFKMLTASAAIKSGLEQLCCSTHTGLTLRDRVIELGELTIPPFTANHVFDHLQSMLALAKGIHEMPGADLIKVDPLPRRGSSWPVRIALAGGLVCLVALLFTQPYNRMPGASANTNTIAPPSGVAPGDAVRIQQLQGWHAATRDDFPAAVQRYLQERRLEPSGHIVADFGGGGSAVDSAYLLIDTSGRKRVTMLSRGAVAYDAIFPKVDFLARISKSAYGEDTMDDVRSSVISRWRWFTGCAKRERSNRKRGVVETRRANPLGPSRRLQQNRSGYAITEFKNRNSSL